MFRLASNDLPRRAISLVKDERRHQKFGDFDDHLENVSIGAVFGPSILMSLFYMVAQQIGFETALAFLQLCSKLPRLDPSLPPVIDTVSVRWY